MYITLTAAFRSEEQPDYENLGITPDPTDFNDVDWMPLHVHYDNIGVIHKNEVGNTNIELRSGGGWTVKEKPDSIMGEVSDLAEKYR